MGLLSRLATQMGRRSYRLPLGDDLAALMTVDRMPKDAAYVHWAFDAPREALNRERSAQTKGRIGLTAMRRVMEALERDARKHAPASYRFRGASDGLNSLYESLGGRAEQLGYQMRPGVDGADTELVRMFDPLGRRISEDALKDALLYGGAGAGMGYLASR